MNTKLQPNHFQTSLPYAACALALTAVTAIRAGEITVNQSVCNLVDAITAANTDQPAGGCPAGTGPDTLRLVVPVYTLTQINNGGGGDWLTHDPNGLPVITSDIYLNGKPNSLNDPGVVIERAAAPDTPPFRLVDVGPQGKLAVQGVTFLNGFAVGGNLAPEGGAIRNAGWLQLIGCTVANSTASSGRPAAGIGGIRNGQTGTAELYSTVVTKNAGGIGNGGTLSLRESTVSNNTNRSASPFARLVGLDNQGRATILNSTISGNKTGFRNSGIAEVTNSTVSGNSRGGFVNLSAVATLNYVTLAWNRESEPLAPNGSRGALVSTPTGKVTLSNCIVANSIGADCRGSVRLTGVNLIGDGSCRAKARGALSGNPELGLLTNNGGLTETHALLSGSPAINASTETNFYPETDQRGVPRPKGERDLGAFEGAVTAAIGDWQLVTGDRSYAADLDGDRKDEIFVQNGRYAAVLGQTAGSWTSQAVSGNWVGRRWRLDAGDRAYVGDFDGDGKAEIFTRGARAATILRLDGTRLKTTGIISRGAIGEWQLHADDESCVGDLDGDGHDEIFVHRDTSAAVLNYQDGRLGSDIIAASPIGAWPLRAGDVCHSGDFDGDGRDEIYMRSANQAGLLVYTGSALTSQTVASGSIGSWQMNPTDRSYVGDFDGNGQSEVYVRNVVFAPGYVGLLAYRGSQLVSLSVAAGPIGEWSLIGDYRSSVGDFDRGGKDGVFVHRARTAGLLGYSGGLWDSETVVRRHIGEWPLRRGDRSTVGDFDGRGGDQIFVRNDERAGLLRYRDGELQSSVIVRGR